MCSKRQNKIRVNVSKQRKQLQIICLLNNAYYHEESLPICLQNNPICHSKTLAMWLELTSLFPLRLPSLLFLPSPVHRSGRVWRPANEETVRRSARSWWAAPARTAPPSKPRVIETSVTCTVKPCPDIKHSVFKCSTVFLSSSTFSLISTLLLQLRREKKM